MTLPYLKYSNKEVFAPQAYILAAIVWDMNVHNSHSGQSIAEFVAEETRNITYHASKTHGDFISTLQQRLEYKQYAAAENYDFINWLNLNLVIDHADELATYHVSSTLEMSGVGSEDQTWNDRLYFSYKSGDGETVMIFYQRVKDLPIPLYKLQFVGRNQLVGDFISSIKSEAAAHKDKLITVLEKLLCLPYRPENFLQNQIALMQTF